MKQFICNRCDRAFTEYEADTIDERHDEVRPIFVEHFLCCPGCGSTDFGDAVECCRCHRPYRFTDLLGGYYCKECMEEMRNPYHERLFVDESLDEFAEWLHERRQANGKS